MKFNYNLEGRNSYTYKTYREYIDTLHAQNKTTGNDHSEAMLTYSNMNVTRMKRLDKTIEIEDEIIAEFQKIDETQKWLVITESWCGDAAQNLPIIHKLAELNDKIELKLVLRDENLELMDLFLTNESRSIPKVIILDNELNVLNTWGPRPSFATKMVHEYKEKNGSLDAHFKQDLQVWYNKDKGKNVQEDFINLINSTLIHS